MYDIDNLILSSTKYITFHSYQSQNGHQNRKQQRATTNHYELLQAITSPSPASHPEQSLYLKLAQEVQGAPPQQADSLPILHLEDHIDTSFPSL
ncbi:hypothetical protein HanXRQr2_Chr06g0267901 [Helianthus annuus]|uniref:Uncharacterized protein n=1 Tax=Helianthus annuus TaxID=4232 RepID=A0A9K3IUG6_HELAN|nr:hypothetical protein HanXRQr2_Chr06g0267901 [Helianthus annuus]